MRWLWPRSLSGRIIALTFLALLLSQLVSFFIFMHERDRFLVHVVLGSVSENVAAATRALDHVDPGQASALVRALSTRDLRFQLRDTPHLPAAHGGRAAAFVGELAERLDVSPERIRVVIGPGLARGPSRQGGDALTFALRLDDGRWLIARQRLFDPTAHWARSSLITLSVSALVMLIVVVFASRHMTRPLRELAHAAERFGRGERVQPLPVRGPAEIRSSVVAFNRMRERLARFVADRTQLIAAIAHDLRTPITALRLRLEFLPDDDNTRAMAATLDDMAGMSESALTFMREEAAAEATRNVDLNALIDALCEDYRALGKRVAFEPGERVTLVCRPVAIRRALRNLLDNALAYAGAAEVRLQGQADSVTIDILDDGPGIDVAEHKRVFDPFVRLESSRSRETGGAGLGLSIARSVVQGHGGEITLANRPEGGLRVHIHLPRALKV